MKTLSLLSVVWRMGIQFRKKHAFCMRAFVRNYWELYFGNDALIEDLELSELDDFFFFLHDEKGLAGETVNKNINMANKCFKTLLAQKKIAANPLEGIERFKADNEERGIPTLYNKRRELLKAAGIDIELDDLLDMYS